MESLKLRRQRTIYKMEEARRIEEAKQKVLRFNEEAEEKAREKEREAMERTMMSQEDRDAELKERKAQEDFWAHAATVPKHYSLVHGKHVKELCPDFDEEEFEKDLKAYKLVREREIAQENSEVNIDGDSSEVHKPSDAGTDTGDDGHEEPLLEQGTQPGDNNL